MLRDRMATESSPTPELNFYFDYISPYAYLAWRRLRRSPYRLHAQPILFAALLDANGQLGPAEIPSKRNYVMKDVLRLARRQGDAICCPAAHPFNPLLPLRLTTAAEDPELRAKLVDAFYEACWCKRERIDTPTAAAEVLRRVGVDPQSWLPRAQDPQVKSKLRQATEHALGLGVFGVPSVLVDGALFWGVDSLDHLDHFVEHGGESLDAQELERWHKLEAAARRPKAGAPG